MRDRRGRIGTAEANLREQIGELLAEEGDLKIEVVVNYDMQNFEELINPESPKCIRSASQSLPMPNQWSNNAGRKFDLRGRSQARLAVDV